ncbi:MAG: hypothetical protein IJD13_01010 [Oscillospiraceae bacterium]|nr:hypothetical protein [Oscillospiraceae bacterium]
MKKLIAVILFLVCTFGLVSCSSGEKHTVEIVIPAGSTRAFVYSDEEISPRKDYIIVSAGAGIASTQVVLAPAGTDGQNTYEPVTVKQREAARISAEKGAWFKIGVGILNPSDRDITVSVEVENVDIRIE